MERVSPRGGRAREEEEAMAEAPAAASMPEWRVGVCCGKSEKAGDFIGCGEVARRGRASSSLSTRSLMVLSFSRVACRRSRRDALVVPLGLSTPLNMTLYRSSRMSGMSTLSRPGPPLEEEEAERVETEARGAEMVGQLGSSSTVTTGGGGGSVLDRMMMGLCFGVFLLATVLLLAGVGSAVTVVVKLGPRLGSTGAGSGTLGGSACFLPPNSEPNRRLFCVLVRCTLGCCSRGGVGIWAV